MIKIITTKSGKNQNGQRKGKLQVLSNIRSRHHQTSGERKNLKRVSQEKEKTTQNQAI